jgi:hypothetical protein
MTNGYDTEALRRVAASVIMWGGWGGCIGLGTWAIVEFDPNHGDFAPQWVGLGFILLMGVAIAGTLARSRMRLTHAILTAFRAGVDSANEETDRRVEAITDRLDTANSIKINTARIAELERELRNQDS